MSVLIPHYGDPALALRVVGQIQSQRTGGAVEIIVVDDCSPLPFPSVPGVRTTRQVTNGGFGSAVNAGAKLARHPYLLVLNNDVEFGSSFLEDLSAAAELHGGVLGPRVLTSDGRVSPTARRFSRRRHYVIEWLSPLARFRDTAAWHRAVGHDNRVYASNDFNTDWVVGCALMLPRDQFLDIGGFDPRYHMNCEEVDLQRRLRIRGIGTTYVASVTCGHESGSSSGNAVMRRRRVCKARFAYVEKWDGPRARLELQLALTAATVLNALWNIGRHISGRPAEILHQARLELSLIWGFQYTPRSDL